MNDIPDDIRSRLTLKTVDGITRVTKIKHEPKPCTNCDLTVVNQRESIVIQNTDLGAVRRRCVNCGNKYNCFTKEYHITNPKEWRQYVARLGKEARKTKK